MTKRFEIKNLIAIRVGIDRHNARCPIPAEAILMNPIDCKLMNHRRLWGVPVLPDPSVPTKRCRIQCEGSAEDIETELAMHIDDC
jgi:hypothetical protein